MATLNKPVGYEYEFVDQVPEDYFCKLCKHVAREYTITTCCGETFCKGCIDTITQEQKPCTHCCKNGFSSVLQPKYQAKILALEVRCTVKDRGCPWTGQLQHLNAHLDVAIGDCRYVDVECPKKCVQKVQKRNVDTHLVNECPNRDYRCPHCNFANKYHVVSDHFDVCPYYPLACPNRCGATFERDDLPDHMKMCRLEEVQCVFNNEGCQAKFIRENEDEHMDQNTQKHLALMPAATLRISQDFEQKLQEQQEVFEKKMKQKKEEHEQKQKENDERMQQLGGQLQQNDKQIKQAEQNLQDQQEVFEKKLEEKDELLEQKLEKQSQEFQEQLRGQQKEFQKQLQQRDDQIRKVQLKNEELQQLVERNFQQMLPMINKMQSYTDQCDPPHDCTLSNYQQAKARNGFIGSPPMYTHPGGYQFKLKLYPNGLVSGDGMHVTVYVYSLKSDHDATLKIPVKFTITLQLLNQHRNQDHHTRDIQCEMETREMIGMVWAVGSDSTFISHADLEWNSDKQTQYLKDDCLKVRITKIVVH